jgi:hypothetical protein
MTLANSRPAFRTRGRTRPRTRNNPSSNTDDEDRCAEYEDEYESSNRFIRRCCGQHGDSKTA